jgi:hypothetical protein
MLNCRDQSGHLDVDEIPVMISCVDGIWRYMNSIDLAQYRGKQSDILWTVVKIQIMSGPDERLSASHYITLQPGSLRVIRCISALTIQILGSRPTESDMDSSECAEITLLFVVRTPFYAVDHLLCYQEYRM